MYVSLVSFGRVVIPNFRAAQHYGVAEGLLNEKLYALLSLKFRKAVKSRQAMLAITTASGIHCTIKRSTQKRRLNSERQSNWPLTMLIIILTLGLA